MATLHIFFSLIAFFNFDVLDLPDDFTNQAVVVMIEMTFSIMAIESFCKQRNYYSVVDNFVEFDNIVQSSAKHIDMSIVYKRWKRVYYKKIFSYWFLSMICYFIGSLIYLRWSTITIRLVAILMGLAKAGIFAKAAQIGFYMDMICERLILMDQLLEHGDTQLVTRLYVLLWRICANLNDSLGLYIMSLYLLSVIDLVNVTHIMFWNLRVLTRYSHLTTVGIVSLMISILMPVWTMVESCHRCHSKVSQTDY